MRLMRNNLHKNKIRKVLDDHSWIICLSLNSFRRFLFFVFAAMLIHLHRTTAVRSTDQEFKLGNNFDILYSIKL